MVRWRLLNSVIALVFRYAFGKEYFMLANIHAVCQNAYDSMTASIHITSSFVKSKGTLSWM